MKDSIKIDTVKLGEYVEQLKKDNEKIKEIFENIRKSADNLPNLWQSDTCDITMAEFNKLYKDFDTINDTNEKYVSFLADIVSGDYSDKDESVNQIINSNI